MSGPPLPGVSGLEGREEGRWQPGGAGRGGGGDSGRAGAPCGPEGCVRGAGGGCHCRLSQRRGTLAASSSRRGPTRPGLAASGESPNPPGTLHRVGTNPHPGGNVRSWNDRSPPTELLLHLLPRGAPPLPRTPLKLPLATAYLLMMLAGPAAASALPSCRDPLKAPSPLSSKSGDTGRRPLSGAEPKLRRLLTNKNNSRESSKMAYFTYIHSLPS